MPQEPSLTKLVEPRWLDIFGFIPDDKRYNVAFEGELFFFIPPVQSKIKAQLQQNCD